MKKRTETEQTEQPEQTEQKQKPERLEKRLTVLLDSDLISRINAAANERRMTMSEYLRTALLSQLERDGIAPYDPGRDDDPLKYSKQFNLSLDPGDLATAKDNARRQYISLASYIRLAVRDRNRAIERGEI